MSKLKHISTFITVSMLCCSMTQSFAQPKWEYDFVKNVNPRFASSDVWKGFSTTAKPLAVAIPAGMLVVSLINKDKTGQLNAYEAFAGLAITTVTTEALKATVKRQRPYFVDPDIYPDKIEGGYSFPSGHTSVAFSTATSLTLTCKKWYIAVPAFAWATGVGYSRMYLGQHFPSDVFAGAIVGAGSAYLSHWLNKKFFAGKKKK